MLIWSAFRFHDCACHAGVVKTIVVLFTWTFLKTRPMRQKRGKMYPLRFLQDSWKTSVLLPNGSGFQAKYVGTWWNIFEAKRSMCGVQKISQIFLKISGFRFYSLESVADRDWWSASTLETIHKIRTLKFDDFQTPPLPLYALKQ